MGVATVPGAICKEKMSHALEDELAINNGDRSDSFVRLGPRTLRS